MPRLSRRRFLGLSAAAGGAALAAPWAWARWRRGDATDVVVAVLRRRVGHLPVPAASFAPFARAYVASKPAHRAALERLSPAALPLAHLTAYRWVPRGHPLRRLEDNVVSTYLLSTDFFERDRHARRRVRYLGFHDPLERPCRNPFARRPAAVATRG